jgi:arsenate reductase (glutaredoxin)
MKKLTIYHNGECSKCKETTELLRDKGYEIAYRFYLLEPPTEAELKEVLSKLQVNPSELVRKTEPLYMEQYEGKVLTEEQWLQVLLQHPVLMQRPVAVNGNRAIIARPPEKVLEIL